MEHSSRSIPSPIPYSYFRRAFVLGVLLLWASASLSGQKVFTGPMDYVVGAEPNSVVVADFNGDGLPDFATANSSANSVTVVLQNPDGTFQPPVSYAVGNSPASLQVGDVNQDGFADLVAINLTDNTLSTLLGNGDGTFQPQKVTTVVGPITGATCCLALADFNGDGKLDVAAPVPVPTQVGAYGVAILLGNGDGTFQAPVIYPTNAKSSAIVTADFNNDGKPDIAAGNSILLGNGDGTFQAPISVALPSGPLVVADFNQDGNMDIATSGITILLGSGDGTFQSQQLSLQSVPLAAGDLNGDGKTDLVAASVNSGVVSIESLMNEGASTFTLAQTIETNYAAAAVAELKSGQPVDLLIANASVGVLSFESPGVTTILNGNGDGTFSTFPSYSAYPASEGSTALGTIAAADFNGDGKPDVAVAEEIGDGHGSFTYQVSLLLNNGTGFAQPALIQLQMSGLYLVAADFNGDGKSDLALAGNGVGVLLGNGDGTFQSEVGYGAGMNGPLAVGDFNNDGKLDVLGTNLTGDLAVILGNGDGTFGLPLNSPVGGYGAATSYFAVADFNSDGKLDVAALVTNNQQQPLLQIMLGNGDGTFSIGAGYSLASKPVAIAWGDMNGDGIPDVLVGVVNSDEITYEIETFLGKGDGTFGSPLSTVAGNGIYSMVVADFNLDGKQDVAFSNAGWGDVSLLLGNGDGTFETGLQFWTSPETGGNGNALAVSDFDGNGSPDIAVTNYSGITLMLGSGNAAEKSGSAAVLSSAALAFGNEMVGQTSTPQSVVLTNTNSAVLNISSIQITGLQSADYQQSTTCGTKLPAGGSCTINITFSPQSAGSRAAAVQITDNAFNSPQMISLSGMGTAAPDFTFGMGSGGSSSSTISAGQTATFSLALTPVGSFTGTVNLTCNVTPVVTPAPICSVPKSINVSGSSTTTVTVTVTTTAAGNAGTMPFGDLPPGFWFVGWAVALSASVLMLLRNRPRLAWAPVFVLAVLFTAGCGGGGGGQSTPPDNGTPPGSYAVTVTATSGNLSHQAALTVIVQ